jgi:transposase InsO family protein
VVVNALRGLLDPVDGLLRDARYVIHDRDPLFGSDFARLLTVAGVTSMRLPARSPNLNAFAERFVGSIRRECLSRVIPLGRRHLEQLIFEYLEHYHRERNHQGRGNRLLTALPSNDNLAGAPIRRRERLGGLLSYYHRDVA